MATYPGWQTFATMTYTGGGTASASGQSASLPNGATATTPFLDCGGTPNRVAWEASQTLTCRGRSSVAAAGQDQNLIFPATSESYAKYESSGNVLPTDASFGWTKSGTYTTESASGGVLTLAASGAADYRKFPAGLTASALHVVQWTVTITAGTAGLVEFYFGTGSYRWRVGFAGSSYGAGAGKVYLGGAYYSHSTYSWSAGTKYDVLLIVRGANGSNPQALAYIRPRGSYASRDGQGYTLIGVVPSDGSQNILIFGNLAGGSWGATIEDFQVYQGDEWATLTSGGNPGSSGPTSRRHLSIELTNSSGATATLTDLDFGSDSTVPGVVANVLAHASGNDLFVRGDSTANQYRTFRLLNDSNTVLDEWELPTPGFAFCSLASGQYKASVAQVTDDGVTGSFTVYPSSGTMTVPADPVVVDLTLNTATPTPGQALALTVARTGSIDAVRIGGVTVSDGRVTIATCAAASVSITVAPATVGLDESSYIDGTLTNISVATVNGSPWTGSHTAVVTGTGGGGGGSTPPSDPPAIRLVTGPSTPGVARFADGGFIMELYEVTAGSNPMDEAGRDLSDDALTWSEDTTEGYARVAYADLTFSGTRGDLHYAVNHGWPDPPAGQFVRYWYTDTAGRKVYSPALYVGTGADWEVAVTGHGLAALAGARVAARLTQAVRGGTTTYPTTGYTAVIASDGTWTMTGLPRLEKDGLVALDGASTVYVVWELPGGGVAKSSLPDAAVASFEGLTFVGL